MITTSIVIPVYNEADCLSALVEALAEQQLKCKSTLELVFVDDGSSDSTWHKLQLLAPQGMDIRLARFSRNFGKEAAITCGLRLATGNAVVIMDADMQDPPELLPQMLEHWQYGADIVCARRSDRQHDHLIKRLAAKLFHRLFNRLSETPNNIHVGDFRLLDRKVVRVLNEMPESTRYMKGLLSWPGFRQKTISFKRPARILGKTKFGFWKLFKLALDGIISFSTIPLRIWGWLGLAIMLAALAYAAYSIIHSMAYGLAVSTDSWLITLILLLGGVQLMGIGVVGEYLSRVYEESRQRPLFVIEQLRGIPDQQIRRLKKRMPKELAAIENGVKEPVHRLVDVAK